MLRLILILILLLPIGAYSGPRPFIGQMSPQDTAIYRELLQEFALETSEFDKTQESILVRQNFTQEWKDFVSGEKPLSWSWLQGYSWSSRLREFFSLVPDISARATDLSQIENVSLSRVDKNAAHSIANPGLYASQRIGESIVTTLKKHQVQAILYGGSLKTLGSALGVRSERLYGVLSPYSDWGLHKVFVPGSETADGKPRFVMVIPPSTQYLSHYASMMAFVDIKLERVLLNRQDQKEQIESLVKSFKDYQKKTSAHPDVIALGYSKDLSETLSLSGKKETHLGQGVSVQLVEDTKATPKLQYLLIKSDLTIWGESSAFLIRAALSLDPKLVLFMGSAGGINMKTALYDMAVPSEFMLNGVKLPIENQVYESLKRLNKASGTSLGMRHGHTDSPIQQTKDYVNERILQGIDTFDVEQNLIAEAILRHNKTESRNVLFGAVNVITDKPHSHLFHWKQNYDLVSINKQQKVDSRKRAVLNTIESLRLSEKLAASRGVNRCGTYFAEAL